MIDYRSCKFLYIENSCFSYLIAGIINLFTFKLIPFKFPVLYAPSPIAGMIMNYLRIEDQSNYLFEHQNNESNYTIDEIMNYVENDDLSVFNNDLIEDSFYYAIGTVKLGSLVSCCLIPLFALIIYFSKLNFSGLFPPEVVSGLLFTTGIFVLTYSQTVIGYNFFTGECEYKRLLIFFILFILLIYLYSFNARWFSRSAGVILFFASYVLCLIVYIFDYKSSNSVLDFSWSDNVKAISYSSKSMKTISCPFNYSTKTFFTLLIVNMLVEIDSLVVLLPNRIKNMEKEKKKDYIKYLCVTFLIRIIGTFFGVPPLAISIYASSYSQKLEDCTSLIFCAIIQIVISIFNVIMLLFRNLPDPTCSILIAMCAIYYIALAIQSLFFTHLHSFILRNLFLFLITVFYGIGYNIMFIDKHYPLYISCFSIATLFAVIYKLVLPQYFNYINSGSELSRQNSMSFFYRKKYENPQIPTQQTKYIKRGSRLSTKVVKPHPEERVSVDVTWNMNKELVRKSIIKTQPSILQYKQSNKVNG